MILIHEQFVIILFFVHFTASSFSQVKNPKAESTIDTINVEWTKPDGAVTGYRTTCTPADATESEVKTKDESKSFASFEGLVSGREYQLEIYATHDGKEGDKTVVKKATSKKCVFIFDLDIVGSKQGWLAVA